MLKKTVPVVLSLLFASQSFASPKLLMDCTRDRRPVDGALTQYEVKQSEDGTYSFSLSKAFYSQETGPSDTQTTLLLDGLTCSYPSQKNNPVVLTCKSDQRPVDGPLSTLSVIEYDKKGNYTLTLDTDAVSRGDGKPFHSTKMIERSIKCTFPN